MNTNLFTPTQQFKPQGILVTVNGSLPVVAYPATTIVTKAGKKQFFFWYRNKSTLAVWNGNGYVAKF